MPRRCRADADAPPIFAPCRRAAEVDAAPQHFRQISSFPTPRHSVMLRFARHADTISPHDASPRASTPIIAADVAGVAEMFYSLARRDYAPFVAAIRAQVPSCAAPPPTPHDAVDTLAACLMRFAAAAIRLRRRRLIATPVCQPTPQRCVTPPSPQPPSAAILMIYHFADAARTKSRGSREGRASAARRRVFLRR